MRLLLLHILGIVVQVCKKCSAVHQENSIRSNSGCFGSSGPIFMTLSCSAGQVISIDQIWVGVKYTSTGCPPVFDTSYDVSCCSPSANPADDCIFAFDHTEFAFYHDACQGQQSCSPRVLQVLSAAGSCDPTIFHVTTTFAYIDYVCVDATELNSICTPTSATIASDYTYITSDGFPSAMSTSTSPCTCSVQTDDPSATLQVVTIQRMFTRNTNVTCDQSLSLLDVSQTSLFTWTCDDNTYAEDTVNVSANYVILSLTNDRSAADGHFWAEIRASPQTANLVLECPAQIPTTTTTTPATTTATTATSTTTYMTTTTTPDPTTTTTVATISTTDPTTSTMLMTTTKSVDTTTNENSTLTGKQEKNSFLVPFIVFVVLAILLLITVVVLIYCLCRQKGVNRDKGTSDDPERETIIDHSSRQLPETSLKHMAKVNGIDETQNIEREDVCQNDENTVDEVYLKQGVKESVGDKKQIFGPESDIVQVQNVSDEKQRFGPESDIAQVQSVSDEKQRFGPESDIAQVQSVSDEKQRFGPESDIVQLAPVEAIFQDPAPSIPAAATPVVTKQLKRTYSSRKKNTILPSITTNTAPEVRPEPDPVNMIIQRLKKQMKLTLNNQNLLFLNQQRTTQWQKRKQDRNHSVQ